MTTMPVGSTVPADLNPRQREAVLYLNGPCLVLAGAGSGKTRVITQKMAYLLRECGYAGRHVVALTFTNKAAREMSERLHALVDRKLSKGLMVSTFHSLGLRFLREEAQGVGLKPAFSILDATDALAIIQELLATTDKGRLRSVQQTISLWKNALLDPDRAAAGAATPEEVDAARVYRSYQATLQAYQAVDFDDLIRLPAQLLEADEDVRRRWQARVQYLLIDEYQDTNQCQYQIVRLLVGDRAMFTAVGDDDQAIYAWRGATVENLSRLEQDYANLKLIKLEQNYRSVQRILTAANNVIGKNPRIFGKTLWSELGVGEPIQVSPADDELAEAQAIGVRLSASRFERQAKWRDFAVLYRSNHQARIIEQAFRDLRIPYTISGGQSFFDKAEVRDILAYLRLVANDEDDPAFIRAVTTPRRGIGQATLQTLGQFAAERRLPMFAAVFEIGSTELLAARHYEPLRVFAAFIQKLQENRDPVPEVLDGLLAAIGYENYLFDTQEERAAQSRWQNVLELLGWLKRKATEDGLQLKELAQHVALVTMLDRGDDEEPDAVKLSTLHAAKGLEYPHVYLAGVEEGLLPHAGREEDELPGEAGELQRVQRIEEERRLMYVGITRAQRTLHLTWCRRRRRAREDVMREPSRFIKEMALDGGGKAAPEDAGVSPKQRLDMLKALLKK
ncbi:UvrD-helicase domain-containing protein [Paracandidimonas soli]|uniref:ATP-dependent DNA helicase Rep n=1 Tax=Paracandidimonas soli TaxID=1917182 RepID=A0A4R3V5U3_9BURK|nr:UvrD-helicase domain-containing protein [Paracandidimonas soli]TCU98962.1 ATP-dependent DNA helicase Rep [Paracandidimonas soli]